MLALPGSLSASCMWLHCRHIQQSVISHDEAPQCNHCVTLQTCTFLAGVGDIRASTLVAVLKCPPVHLHFLLLVSRVVNVSSISEQLGLFALYTPTIPYDDIQGYNLGTDSGEKPYVIAKTHILMASTRELAKRLEGSGVDVIAGEHHSCKCSVHTHAAVLCVAAAASMNRRQCSANWDI